MRAFIRENSKAGVFLLRSVVIGWLVILPIAAQGQIQPPPIPDGAPPPLPTPEYCNSGDIYNANFEPYDPCCYADANRRPAYCPVANQPFRVLEIAVSNQIASLLTTFGFPNIQGSDTIPREIGQFIVREGIDYLTRLASGGSSNGGGPLSLSIPQVAAQLNSNDYLTTVMFASVASISSDPNFVITEDVSYKLPYPAAPTILDACQGAGGKHKDRNFNLSVMNETVENGQYVFTAQAGVPTEISANRPSWVSRQIYDYRWMWWFGDASMVPYSRKQYSSTVHQYSRKGDHTLAFVMLRNDPYFEIGFSGSGDNFINDLYFRKDDSDDYFTRACNYGTMRVVENSRPVAAAGMGPNNMQYQMRFTASGSFDPDGNPLAYLWRLSDGSTTRARTFTKTYAANQVGTTDWIQLTVSDGAKMHTITRNFIVNTSTCPSDGPFVPIAGGICDDERGEPGLPGPGGL